MQIFLKNMKKGIVSFLLVVFIGFGLLFLVNLLPTGRISAHVRLSGATLINEGDYWLITQGDMSAHLDNYTDAIMLLTAGYTGDDSALDKTIYNYRIMQKDATRGESCSNCGIIPENQAKKLSYIRYWQGYLIILKPLLLFFNLMQIRKLNTFVMLSFMMLICILLHHRKKSAYILPYLASVAFMNPGTLFVSLQYSDIFYLTSIYIVILLLFFDRAKFRTNIWLFFLIAGMCTSYFDFLTYPVLTMAFPLLIFFLLEEPPKFLTAIFQLIGFSSLWCIGYAGMWSSKWVIASLITGKNQITKSLDIVQQRSGHTIVGIPFTWSDMMNTMKEHLNNGVTKHLILLILLISIILVIISKGYRQKERFITAVLFAVISLYPFIWYTFAANHSAQHNFFTYKSMAVFVFACSSCLLPLVDWQRIRFPNSLS